VTNAIRAHLAEFGIVAPTGRNGVDALFAIINDHKDDRIPGLVRTCLS
jgi:transposase